MITNDAVCRCEIKSKIVMVEAAFNKKRTFPPTNSTFFTIKLDLKIEGSI
jgi:hypothetical protein